jgi:hypothetical protein
MFSTKLKLPTAAGRGSFRIATAVAGSLVVAGLAGASPVRAQEQPAPAASEARTDDLDKSIAAYGAIVDRFDRALERQGRKARKDEVKALAKAARKANRGGPKIGTPAQNARLQDLYESQLSQWVAASPPQDAATGDAELIAAADALFALEASADDKALLAEGVYDATLVGHQDEQLGDGHNSTLTYRINEAVKAAPGHSGDTVKVRLVSGRLPDGSSLRITAEFIPEQGSRVLLFTSRGLYATQASLNGGAPGEAVTAYASSPYLLNGEELLPTTSGQPRERRSKKDVTASIKSKAVGRNK